MVLNFQLVLELGRIAAGTMLVVSFFIGWLIFRKIDNWMVRRSTMGYLLIATWAFLTSVNELLLIPFLNNSTQGLGFISIMIIIGAQLVIASSRRMVHGRLGNCTDGVSISKVCMD